MYDFTPRFKLSLAFGLADTSKSVALTGIGGFLKNLHLRVPNFTNAVTATVTLEDADGYVLWSSAAKAENANYNLEADAEWQDQLICKELTLKVTLSGAPGGSGGTVIIAGRIFGKAG